MKTITYFTMLIFGAVALYFFAGVVTGQLIWLVIKSGMPLDSILAKGLYILIAIIQIVIGSTFLIFRVYRSFKEKQILIPDTYQGLTYAVCAIFSFLILMTIGMTLYLTYAAPAGSVSGVPLGLLLIPTCVVGMLMTLRCEVPELMRYRALLKK